MMYYENNVISRIHLQPGRDHYWSEVLLRASSAVRVTSRLLCFDTVGSDIRGVFQELPEPNRACPVGVW